MKMLERTLFISEARAFEAARHTLQFVGNALTYKARLSIDVRPVTIREPGQAPERGYHARIVDQDGRVVAFA